jgi:hypothetical protein
VAESPQQIAACRERCEQGLRALEQEQPFHDFDREVAAICHPYYLSYHDCNDRELLERHGRLITRALGNIQPPEQRPRLSLTAPTPGDAPIPRIRIGFLSGFFSNHSNARAFDGLILHLDGARLFNAMAARKEDPQAYGKLFHSISICLSKGLGAPVGSLLLGDEAFIKKARRVRKVFGGGMRQAGILAAAGIYALENHVERLTKDHLHARMIEEALRAKPFIAEILPVETNIVIASFNAPYTPQQFMDAMKQHNILMFAISPTQIRMVLHLDISTEMVENTIKIIQNL